MTTFPTSAISTTNVSSASTAGSPAAFRADALTLINALNAIIALAGQPGGTAMLDSLGKLLVGTNFSLDPNSGNPKINLSSSAYLWYDSSNTVLKLNLGGTDYPLYSSNNLPVIPNTTGFRNRLYNGNFDVWQRGTSYTPTAGTIAAGYTADRWFVLRGSNVSGITASRAGTSGVANSQYSMKIQRTAGDTKTNQMNLGQMLAAEDAIYLTNQNVALSFWAAAGANLSGTLNAKISWGNGSSTNNILNGTGWTDVTVSSLSSLNTSFQKYSLNAFIPSNAVNISVVFVYTPSGTAGADDSFYISQAQLEPVIANVATGNFEIRPVLQELAMCQRFCVRVGGQDIYENFGIGHAVSSTRGFFTINIPQPLRATPTVVINGLSNFLIIQLYGLTTHAPSGMSIGSSMQNTNKVRINVDDSSASVFYGGGGASEGYMLIANNSTNAWIDFFAEI